MHVQSVVLGWHVVRLSVTLVDQDHIGWKSWKLIARSVNTVPSLFAALRSSTYSQRNMGKFGEPQTLIAMISGTSEATDFFRVPPIISGVEKATDFQFGGYIHRIHPNKSPLKIFEKMECGGIQGLPKFFGYPYYLRNGKSYRFQIWQIHSLNPPEQRPIKN